MTPAGTPGGPTGIDRLRADGIRTAVVVAPSPVPLRLGGAERHWQGLHDALVDAGIETDVVKLPVREDHLVDLVEAYEAFLRLDLTHADLVVSGKYPAWMVQHPRHVVWMLHPLRGLYDTWGPGSATHGPLPSHEAVRHLEELLSADPDEVDPRRTIDAVRSVADALDPGSDDVLAVPGDLARGVVHQLDRWALDPRRVAGHAAISARVAARADYFPPDLPVAVVLPPSCLPDPEPAEPGDDLLVVGRLDGPKRVDLAIEAFTRTRSAHPDSRLLVVGDGPERTRLEGLASGDPRVRFLGRVDDDTLRRTYLDSRAVAVTPLDEDFGYVTIEAMQHGRAVVTTTDSGGPTELAHDSSDALVVEPTPAALATAFDRLLADPALARRLGDRGRRTAAEHDWAGAVHRLTALVGSARRTGSSRPLLVAASTYPVLGWPGGGPQRARWVLGAMVDAGWDVVVVCLTAEDTEDVREVSDGFRQVQVPLPGRFTDAETKLRKLTSNTAITDAAASVMWPAVPELVRVLRNELRNASAAVAVQPYLAPALVALGPDVPLVLDGHNHEAALKAQMYPDDDAGRWMLDKVVRAEQLAARSAVLVTATTAEDGRTLALDHGIDPARVVVVPNGVDSSAQPFTPLSERAGLRDAALARHGGSGCTRIALFVGSEHKPNIDAGLAVLELAPELPEVLFLLAGRHTTPLRGLHVPPNVRLLGELREEELQQLLAAADVALNPMAAGGGSNLKVLSYFAAGVPVVSTPLGVRGLDEPGRVATVVDLAGFPAAIRARTTEPAAGMVDAARRLVESDYDWHELGRRFAAAVTAAVDPARTPEGDDRGAHTG